MAKHSIFPSLADLKQDIAGAIPVNLIQNWEESDKDEPEHSELLEPYRTYGTVVSSDSAGLSKMSKELPLLEVM